MRTTPRSYRPAPLDPETGEPVPSDGPGTLGADDLQIRDYLQIVYRRGWIIVAMMVAGLLGGLLYNWTTTPIFEAHATLQIDADPNVLALDRPVVDQRDWMREFLPTQLGILNSRELARMAHDALQVSVPPLPSAEGQKHVPPTLGEIVLGRDVQVVKDSRLVNVSFRSTDPAIAAQVSNALARAYVQRTLELRSTTTGEASDWLAQQVKEQRKLVEASEAALQRYREEHGAGALFADRLGEERQNVVVQQLGDLQGQVTKARTDTIDKEAQYRQLSALEASHEPLDTLPAIASNLYIQSLKVDLTTLQRQLAQASNELGARHPEIIKLQGSVENAERKLQTETAKVVQTIRIDFEAAQARERALTGALARQKTAVQALNGKAVEYTALEREATSNRDVLDKLLQRSRETNLARQVQSSNVRIVDSAEIPTAPILPRKWRSVMVGLVGSGATALALVLLLETFNTRMTLPQDVMRHLRIPVLGVAPQVQLQNGQTSLLISDGAPPQFAELLHGLRTNLVMTPELATGRTLLVTSSAPGEGKTMTAANLAVSLARLNQRVLLIDGDLRKPRLHELFGDDQQPGLADALTGTTLAGAFRKTKVARLWLMPSGTASSNPADLLGSERFSQMIALLRSQFDWIVLDSPPVLAVTDPCLIARVASGVLFVVGRGQTSRAVARAAVERLEAAGANLVGALLNRAVLAELGDSYVGYQTYYGQQEGSAWLPELPDGLSKNESTGAAAPLVQG